MGALAANGAACSKGQTGTSQEPTWYPLYATHHCPHPPIQRCQRVPGDPMTLETRLASRFRRWATPSQAPVPTPWEIAPPLEEAPENNLRPRFRASGPGQSLPWTISTRPRKQNSKRGAGLGAPNPHLTHTTFCKMLWPQIPVQNFVQSSVMSIAGYRANNGAYIGHKSHCLRVWEHLAPDPPTLSLALGQDHHTAELAGNDLVKEGATTGQIR